ncbi:MAG: sigma-70 family RNA polymerase sigma factor [Chitinophagales bacterium]
MNTAETILTYRPFLISIAYKMLGSLEDAQDIVQDTFLKWLGLDHSKIENTKSYLAKSTVNRCINHLNNAKKLPITYIDNWLQDSFISKFNFELDLSEKLDFDYNLEAAISQLLQKLNPSERIVYVLKEVLNFDYTEIEIIVEKKKENCRQLLSRAKKRMEDEKFRFHLDTIKLSHFYNKCVDAYRYGKMNGLIEVLKGDLKDEKY